MVDEGTVPEPDLQSLVLPAIGMGAPGQRRLRFRSSSGSRSSRILRWNWSCCGIGRSWRPIFRGIGIFSLKNAFLYYQKNIYEKLETRVISWRIDRVIWTRERIFGVSLGTRWELSSWTNRPSPPTIKADSESEDELKMDKKWISWYLRQ